MLLAYMNRFEPCPFTTEPVVDIFTGEKVADADNGFSDGEFIWYVSEIYYFREYDLAISEEFIDHARKTICITVNRRTVQHSTVRFLFSQY